MMMNDDMNRFTNKTWVIQTRNAGYGGRGSKGNMGMSATMMSNVDVASKM